MTDFRAKLGSLTLDQKIALVSGKDFWTTPAIPEAGIPQLKVTDGPIGARGDLKQFERSACFPSPVAMGATWNPELLAQIAEALAEETKLKGAHVLLGPTINLQRTPIGGRNFECFSEDPHLTAELAVSYVNALQENGVGACPKHYVGNDTEYQRFFISSNMDDATLNEIYLHPFERVSREAPPWMMMAAYNSINGVQACSHRALNVDLLKSNWGFDGVLVSDWFAARDTVGNAMGGLDLEMPGPTRIWGADLKAAIEQGEVPEAELDDKVDRLLHLMERVKPTPQLRPEKGEDKPAHRALIRRAGAEAMVMLKNGDRLLPLDPAFVKSLAVIGPNAEIGQIMGGGSATVNSHPPAHPLDGLKSAFPKAKVKHATGCINFKFLPAFKVGSMKTADGADGMWEERFETSDFTGEPIDGRLVGSQGVVLMSASNDKTARTVRSVRRTGYYTAQHSGPRQLGVYSAGLSRLLVDDELIVDNWTDWKSGDSFFGFGSDEVRATHDFEAGRSYKVTLEYQVPEVQLLAGAQFGIEPYLEDDPIAHAARLAAECDHAVLVLGSNADWESEGHDRADMALPGKQDALAEAVLAANPNTIVLMNIGAPVDMPWYDKAKAVLITWFGGEEMGNAIGDVLTGAAEPGGRLPFTWPKRIEDHPAFSSYPGKDGKMLYTEGRLSGHRWYDKKGITPLAPFGAGLGYGDVNIKDVKLGDGLSNAVFATARVLLTNLANRPSLATVQLYAEPDNSVDAGTPVRRLVGFKKVEVPANGEAEASVDVLNTSVAEWDSLRKERVIPQYVSIVAGLSSAEVIRPK